MPRITTTSVHVDDQGDALAFYTDVLGFVKKDDVDLGEARWLTVVSTDARDGTQLLLEPSDHPAVEPYRSALVSDGIPSATFTVSDVEAEYERLTGLGVNFTQIPLDAGPVTTAVLDDTCGNLIQLVSLNEFPGLDELLAQWSPCRTIGWRWWSGTASIRRPPVFQTGALPTELPDQVV